MESHSIRPVEPDDFNSVFGLLEQLWPDKVLDYKAMKEMFTKNLHQPYQHYVCAVEDSQIIGFCSITIKNNLWQQALLGNVDELVVDERYRGRGVGKSLLDYITGYAIRKGCKRIELDSGFHREEAHQFYENLGFKKRAFMFTKSLID